MDPRAIRLIVILVVWAASCSVSAWLGWDYRAGKAAKEKAAAIEAALSDERETAAKDLQAAIKSARETALAAQARSQATQRGTKDATLKARPDCGRDGDSVRLLTDAIDAANGAAPSAGSMPAGVR